jgi:hypothetical protein
VTYLLSLGHTQAAADMKYFEENGKSRTPLSAIIAAEQQVTHINCYP